MEIGSFIELQFKKGLEWHKGEKDIARLNTARQGIWHAYRVVTQTQTQTQNGKKPAIWIPIYQCDSIRETFEQYGVEVKYYHQDRSFNPTDLRAGDDDAVLLCNYYGIMSQERMRILAQTFKHPIVDCAQAFFCKPVEDALNVYSCRKFVGVPDGCYVVGKDAHLFTEEYPQCYSSDTAAFLLMRIEYGCEGKGYEARGLNEGRIDYEGCMRMSKLTRTILDGTDYQEIIDKRKANFKYIHEQLADINRIDPTFFMDNDTVPMVYPLVVEDDNLIQRLYAAKHFQGHWWSYICDEQSEDSFEHWISRYVIPITIDQRYGKEEMDYLVKVIKG